MNSNLTPENTLQISPSLATTLGLEESVMLAVFANLLHYGEPIAHNGLHWLEVKEATVARTMPFWSDADVQRVCKNLFDKGVIVLGSAPYCSSRVIQFALTETQTAAEFTPQMTQTSQPAEPVVHARNQATRGANRISPHWQPSDDALRHIAQHNIPEQFVLAQVGAFVIYWRDRDSVKHSWDHDFIKYTLREWRYHQTDSSREQKQEQARQHRWDQERFIQKEQEHPMQVGWQPSHDALEVLVKHAGINADYVRDAIPEFIIMWQEKGTITNTWNKKFIDHVRRQWDRQASMIEHNSEPKLMPSNWQPSEDALDVLRLANIDLDFARQQLPEFVLYWRDRKEIHNAWNSKFMQHCKYHWARRHQMAAQQTANTGTPSNNTRERSLNDDLTDRSWAL